MFRKGAARSRPFFTEFKQGVAAAAVLSRTPRRAATRIALHAGAIPHEGKIPAFAAHLAFIAFGLGFGAAFGL